MVQQISCCFIISSDMDNWMNVSYTLALKHFTYSFHINMLIYKVMNFNMPRANEQRLPKEI